ncbi:hypothetical protein EDB81DRAFT_773471 [Dactylonectria macrodidyma]|uniref:Zn(2)-C6 fungal-type domain-containing protein n=1 Tax=Dactylonectria macrodidyma TaxID=307937 RepID=A0A9P9JP24_9HYPO|nr:hypothetical protein EDB81DRAFT_773471 [Dactylonectria macrodidyma]
MSPQGGPATGRVRDGDAPIKARKACVNCRRQKMKCRIDSGPSCRRCLRSGVPCVFVPRANAAAYHLYDDDTSITPLAPLAPLAPLNEQVQVPNTDSSVLRRLKRIEDHIGLPDIDDELVTYVNKTTALDRHDAQDPSLRPLWPAIQVLKTSCSTNTSKDIWTESLIKRLWLTFHDTMLGLHFLPSKQTFSSPTPLLLASMLYCSSIRGSQDVVTLASEYFTVLCNAIAQLCMPASAIGQDAKDPARAEEWAFQTILGIILSGLLREGISKETGVWISIAYRLILEHCPPIMDERSLEWQRLFTGLQIVDLEHASIYLSCPAIPIIAPFPRLRISLQDQLYRLSRMMHTGLTHFTGRGLPTIWSCFSGELATTIDPAVSFSDVDAAVIRDWARQLDDWLVEFGARNDEPENERKLVFRQYVLHRVLVLSIYLPARGSDLFSDTTPREQHELLVSARAAVKLQLADSSIWSNFDLVVITWAALIVIQGVEGGVGEPDDLENVRVHLAGLHEKRKSNLHGLLADCLNQKLQALSTPIFGDEGFHLDGSLDRSWYIFNQSSLQTGYDLFSFDGV